MSSSNLSSPGPRTDPGRSSCPSLQLRRLRSGDERAFRAAHLAMKADHFEFGLEGFDTTSDWESYLGRLDAVAEGVDLVEDRVPATFVVADVGGKIVGRASIRHHLTDRLLSEGGHIGYGVLAEHRRQGWATQILRRSLVIARTLGVDRALLVCDDDNHGSAAVIERCGGILESVGPASDRRLIRRYWIE